VANRRVSVWKYVKIGPNWRYCKPAYSPNNKVKPDVVVVNGSHQYHPEGNYYLRLSAGKGSWRKIGPKAADAVRAADYEESLLSAKALGLPLKDSDTPSLLLSASLWGYLEDYRLSQRPESHNLMKQTLEEFVAFVKKQKVEDITRIDLLKYKQWLVNRGRSVRTAGNKMLRVNQFLRAVMKLEPGKGLVTVRDGKFVEQEPEVFSQEELDKFFGACNGFQTLVFKTFLMSGLRKQELENLEWTDVNFTAGTLKVSAKTGFQPKTWEERVIEIPSDLLTMLRGAMRRSHLVFANKNGNKYTHAWDDCKSIAAKAGIVEAHPHKFRATYATKLLQSGVDLKTVQSLLGHKNLESTMRYLARAQSHEVRAKVDAVWNGK
jgi:integrase/recombinase XerD